MRAGSKDMPDFVLEESCEAMNENTKSGKVKKVLFLRYFLIWVTLRTLQL